MQFMDFVGIMILLAIPLAVLIFWIVAVIIKVKRLKKNRLILIVRSLF